MILGGALIALGALVLVAVLTEVRANRVSEIWLAEKWAARRETERATEQLNQELSAEVG